MKTFYSGRRTTSKNRQVKKHYKQMTNQEITVCRNLLKEAYNKNNYFKLTNHFKGKCKKPVNFKAFVHYIHNKNLDIIEYNETLYNNKIHRRVVVRHPYVVKVDNKLSYQYLVIEVETGEVVTMYYNRVTDNHKTLNLDAYYDKNLKIKY
ncbi:hypothetical protein MRS_099 [Staphylococcus phage MR003]|nr:hypothetical protein MRS_099 [Staphylococcus phage MR003]